MGARAIPAESLGGLLCLKDETTAPDSCTATHAVEQFKKGKRKKIGKSPPKELAPLQAGIALRASVLLLEDAVRPQNCLRILALAASTGNQRLLARSAAVALLHFRQAVMQDRGGLLMLPKEVLGILLDHDCVQVGNPYCCAVYSIGGPHRYIMDLGWMQVQKVLMRRLDCLRVNLQVHALQISQWCTIAGTRSRLNVAISALHCVMQAGEEEIFCTLGLWVMADEKERLQHLYSLTGKPVKWKSRALMSALNGCLESLFFWASHPMHHAFWTLPCHVEDMHHAQSHF